jgi:hypothetical protein
MYSHSFVNSFNAIPTVNGQMNVVSCLPFVDRKFGTMIFYSVFVFC